MQDYRQLTRQLRSRLDPENLIFEKSINEELSSISYADVLEYVRYAMNGVEPAYTQRSKEAGERVKTHLKNGGISDADFQYQGSVLTDTHIKGYSDIDLLVISNKFYSWDSVGVRQILNEGYSSGYQTTQLQKLRYETELTNYAGNALDDLRKLRLDSEVILKSKYLDCDINKPKSIKIENKDLKREVDIVIANWYDDVLSIVNNKGAYRGIQVYNKYEHAKGKVDYPAISIERINERSALTAGRLKKMIRFLKNLKAKSNLTIDLSSFDINAICYDIQVSRYQTATFYQLVPILYAQLKRLTDDINVAYTLKSVDGREYIFWGKSDKLQSLRNLMTEIDSILIDLKNSRIVL
ncbi:nucleotidyltransferase domain-containing protein [Mucilaginibacter sp. 21P]|uniref:nucleotidyltransferase domain-containing protein n=1 Tax=Mucilaginibacter sp. 21P TaxID=2778902 RepID=UPI001C5624F3|nr:nucleotidyltransferase domain-containing protein [Mucilaginibacter sp. 21P]QXV66320.1 nucleotidyltransferase domain-containing protein [Mucilaginibacter sp. 21P]